MAILDLLVQLEKSDFLDLLVQKEQKVIVVLQDLQVELDLLEFKDTPVKEDSKDQSDQRV